MNREIWNRTGIRLGVLEFLTDHAPTGILMMFTPELCDKLTQTIMKHLEEPSPKAGR